MKHKQINPWLNRIDDAEISKITQKLTKFGCFQDHDQWLVVYNTQLFRKRLRYLAQSFPANSLHTFAIKACPLISILKIAVEENFGLEAASIEEVHLALKAGAKESNIIFDSPVKTRTEIQFALENNIHINADNFDELERINQIITPQSQSKIGLRINPEVGEGSISMTSVAGLSSKFGLSISVHREAIIQCFQRFTWLNGLHIHVGSQGCALNMLVNAAQSIDLLKTDINEATAPKRIQWIDIGGGLPTHYGFSTLAIDAKQYIFQLRNLVPKLFDQPLITENGRSLLANCAWAISRIEYLKTQKNKLTATIHFGADFMMRAVYAAKDWPHQYVVLDKQGRLSNEQIIDLSIAGPLCFSGDYLAKNLSLAKPCQDSFIVAKDVGAYTLSTWSRHCNRRLPKVIGYDGEVFNVLFKGENFDDVINFWS